MLTIHDHTSAALMVEIDTTYQELTEQAIIPVTPSSGQIFFRPYHGVCVVDKSREDWFWPSVHYAMESLLGWSNYRSVADVLGINQYTIHVYVPADVDLSDIGEPSEHYNVNWVIHRHTHPGLHSRIVLSPAGLTQGVYSPDNPVTFMQYHVIFR